MIEKNSKTRFNFFKCFFVFSIFLFLFIFGTDKVFASATQGTIDSTNKYAWGENLGWLNFGCSNCNVQVTDSGLRGDAWSSQYGWINLSPNTSGVKNDGEGNLSGYAWGSNIGWIDFSGVTINQSGDFLGYAVVKADSSKINFNCIDGNSCSSADFKVNTDWRPQNVRNTVGGGNGASITRGGRMPLPVSAPVNPPTQITLPPTVITPITNIANTIGEVTNSASNFISNILNPKPTSEPIVIVVPKVAPLSLQTAWNILPVPQINSFVFAPLPYQISTLASRFPELKNTLNSVGVKRMTDMNKLINVTFNIPGLAVELERTLNNVGVNQLGNINDINGVAINTPEISNPGEIKNININVPGLSNTNNNISGNLASGNIALVQGLPLSSFTPAEKKNIPPEFVFARTDGELVDLNVALSIGADGGVTQKIASLPGQMLRLVVKPISAARDVTGYFIFDSATPKISEAPINRSSLSASALAGVQGLVSKVQIPEVPVEQKLVLSSFQYTDSNHDGIYTADVASPSVPGTYEVVTVIDYVDPVLGVRKMSMITVVDPEGYVYEKDGNKETRIPGAVISLYYLNSADKKYELWPATQYNQENPQVTDVSGSYSFLVPAGSYYFHVEAPGYNTYEGKVFIVNVGGGVHENIELESGRTWFNNIDWQTIILVVVGLLLVYNLYRGNVLRSKLLKLANKDDRK